MTAPTEYESVASGDRVILRPLVPADAPEYLQLVTDEAWTRFIGKSSLASASDAEAFIEGTIQDHYGSFGHGLWAIIERSEGRWAGICGPLRRPWLDHPDLGFALLPDFRGRGLARAACELSLNWLEQETAYPAVQAILDPENDRSQALLAGLGFSVVGEVIPPGSEETLGLMERPLRRKD